MPSMRRIVVVMQTSLNNRIAHADGAFWEPFAWGQPEQAWINEIYRPADTWAMSRKLYEVIVPWWEEVAAGRRPDDVTELGPADHDFAAIETRLTKVVFSRTLLSSENVVVISGDLAFRLFALKATEGADIILSAGPRTLGPLIEMPGLIDEYVVAIHPAVVADGPGMFDGVTRDVPLELAGHRVFESGAIVARYRPLGG
jgi:dihydrofolate reductase